MPRDISTANQSPDDSQGGAAVARVTLPYKPRAEQLAFHAAPARFKVLVAHRRLGKTVAAVNELVKAVTSCPFPEAQGAYLAPFRNQAKRVAWGYMKQFTRPIPGMDYNEAELMATFPNGAKAFLGGGDNIHALRGLYLDHCVLDEVAQMHPDIWGQVLRPALSDRKGGATFIGTPMGKNKFFELYTAAGELDGWERFLHPVSETGLIDADELVALRAEMTEDEYLQEFECSFDAAIRGAFWGREMRAAEEEGRVTDVPWEPELDVFTSWDLGHHDGMIVSYWQVSPGGQVRCIDCDALYGAGLTEMAKLVKEKPYIYGGHELPHDVRVTELGYTETRFERLWELGIQAEVQKRVAFEEGVSAGRAMLPRTWFDRTACATLVEALKQWRAQWDAEKQVLRAGELHDWTADYAASVRYFALSGHAQGRRSFGAAQGDLLETLNAELTRAAT